MDLSIIFGKYGEDILHFAASRSVNATALSSADFHFGGRRRRERARAGAGGRAMESINDEPG